MGVQVRVLGDVGITADGVEIVMPAGKQLALLALLALNAGHSVQPDRVILGLWGDDAPADVLKTLQVHVSVLRKRLREYGVEVSFSTAGYRLAVDSEDVDVARFESLAAEGLRAAEDGRPADTRELLSDALAQWSGEALSNVADAPFAGGEAERLEQRRAEVEIARIDANLALGLGSTLVDEIRRVGATAPYDERVCGQLMVALYRSGKQAAALDEARNFRRRLRDDLGLTPGPMLADLEGKILDHDPGLLVPARVRERRRENLPEDVARFIGRHRELDDVRAAVAGSRLTTLTGAGGTGKTRLAIAAARSLIEEFPDGVWLVELAALADPLLVPRTIASTIEARVGELDDLAGEIGERHLLLLVDNCEHLVDAVAEAAAVLLQRCPNLRILATSREPLAIEGERVYRIPPLSVPRDGDELGSAAGDAVELFADRASLQARHFVLDEATTPTVIRICRRVDGLPLAIELAAARLSSLPLEVIADMLSERLSLLSGSHRRSVARQQTIHALVDWSYGLLRDDVKGMLQLLSLFAGGFTLDAVASVSEGDPIELVTELVDKSMVETVANEPGRFRLLETIREYAAEHLALRGHEQVARLRDAHAGYYLEVAREAAPILEAGGHQQAASMRRLTLEHDNLRAAMGTLIDHERWTEGLVMIDHLRLFWDMGGHFREAATLAATVLRRSESVESSHVRGVALCAASDMEDCLGDFQSARVYAEEAAALADGGDDLELAVMAAALLANLDTHAGELHKAYERLQPFEGIDLSGIDSRAEMRLRFAQVLAAVDSADWPRAREVLDSILEAATTAGNTRRRATALVNLSVVDMAAGRLHEASERLEVAHDLVVPTMDLTMLSFIKLNAGLVFCLMGDRLASFTRYRECLLLVGVNGDIQIVYTAVLGHALCAGDLGEDMRIAIVLHGALDAFLESQPSLLDPSERRLRAEDRERRRQIVGEAVFRSAVEAGRAVTGAEAVELALSVGPPVEAGRLTPVPGGR